MRMHWKTIAIGVAAAAGIVLFPLWTWEAPLPPDAYCGSGAAPMQVAPLWAPPVPGAHIDLFIVSSLMLIIAVATTLVIYTDSCQPDEASPTPQRETY